MRRDESQQRDIGWPIAFAAVTAMALYALLLRKFALFGPVSSSLSQLPMIMHFADPQVLAADWYTQSMSGFSARYFYFRAIAGIASLIGLPSTYVAVQILALTSIGSVTLLAAVRAFRFNRVAGAIAGMLAVSVSAFTLGSNVELANNTLIPRNVATPFGLLAMVLALRGAYLRCALAAAVGSLLQPVYGLFPGALALISVAIVRPWRFDPDRAAARSAKPRLGLAMAVIALVAAWWSSLASVDVAAAPDDRPHQEDRLRTARDWRPNGNLNRNPRPSASACGACLRGCRRRHHPRSGAVCGAAPARCSAPVPSRMSTRPRA